MSTNPRRDAAHRRPSARSPLAARRICHATPEAKAAIPMAKSGDGTTPVGRFHYATLLRNRPQVLTAWGINSDDPSVLDRVAEQLGGTLQQLDGNTLSLTTNTTAVEVILTGPDAVQLRWCRNARHACDGRVQHDDGVRRPCTCPPSLAERRAATRHGHGCEPDVDVAFRLLQDPRLGMFAFTSGSWSLAEDVMRAEEVLRTWGEPGLARLCLHRTPCTLAGGLVISCTTPRLTVLAQRATPRVVG
jgi:hypothetical protein